MHNISRFGYIIVFFYLKSPVPVASVVKAQLFRESSVMLLLLLLLFLLFNACANERAPLLPSAICLCVCVCVCVCVREYILN